VQASIVGNESVCRLHRLIERSAPRHRLEF
jgi:hypothetical protein